MADPNQIEQVLLNISVNARDAMPKGGILSFTTEVVDRDELQRRHRDAEADLYVCIAVADTGTGMDERVRLRIFEPFFTTKPFGEGSGLGLAMVYALIKNHNGLIDVESDPGRGTTFRLYLPALRTEEISVSQETPVEPGALKQDKCRGTILIAEDEKAMSRLMENFLVRAGYRVIAAADGEAAIALYLRHKEQIGLVLVDLNLPKASGSEVIRKLKEQTPGLKIIVTSGYLEPEMKSELLQAGVSEYIQKPYAIDQVLEKFQSVYEGS
jgi:CheY-like chemotaxis protein